jgi:hypothetical protein
MFAFGRIVWAIRCTPEAKQTVDPAGCELTTAWAFWPGLISTPLQGPATAGPASVSPMAGSVLDGGVSVLGPAFAVLLGTGFLLGTAFFEGATVGGLLETVPGAWLGFAAGCFEGRAAEPDGPF